MIRKSVRGVIRGRTIELETESGFADGEEVDIVVRSIDAKPDKDAIRAKAAQAREEVDWDEWDAIMEEVQRERKRY
jgi:hypothetical protein